MANQWQNNNSPAAATKATFTQTAGTTGGLNIRLRALEAQYAVLQTVGLVTLQVTDGTNTLFQAPMIAPANSTVSLSLTDLDIRSTTGSLVVGFTAAPSGHAAVQSVNAQGDFCATGVSYQGGN